MTPSALAGDVTVAVFGLLMCTVPAVTRPTVPFGVRVPLTHTGAPVIQRARRVYFWRSASVAVCCTALAFILSGSEAAWPSRVIVLLEMAVNVFCFRLARKKIIEADTSWRTQPQRFPIRWLIPAVSVISATIIIGVIRYPHLPAYLTTGLATVGGRRVPRSPVSAFAMVIGQLYVTCIGTGLMALVYRSRPDIDAADPTATLPRYRRLLDAYTRAVLTMLALIDLTFLLAALQLWGLYDLHGARAALPIVPALVGLLYINRADPAVVVPARVGVGWTLNLGNPTAWMIIGGIIALVAGLAVIRVAAGL
jgi:uncharacterized membrane protein